MGNCLLAEKFRIENRLDKAYAVVISPAENNSSIKEISDFHQLMNEDFRDRLFYLPLENVVERICENVPKSLNSWILEFKRRYLGFEESAIFLNDHTQQ